MSKISDEVLRHIAGFLQPGVDTSLPFSPQNVARELLALRDAARGMEGVNCCPAHMEAMDELRALLPEEPS